MSRIVSSLLIFMLAALFEIGGGYAVWQWLRAGKGIVVGLLGFALLALYGVVPTLQPAAFGRVYVAYGGIFVVVSLLWGWLVDGVPPDRFDWVGGSIILCGSAIMMFWPRGG